MISAYIDASIILRIVLQEEGPLQEWNFLELGVSSEILVIECHRTLLRAHHLRRLDDEGLAEAQSRIIKTLQNLELIGVDSSVIGRASQPLAAPLSTLDAIHLASALLYRSTQPPEEPPLLFATHDVKLAAAARVMNFEVIGVPA